MGWTSYGFKSEEDTMKNEIFLRLYIYSPPTTFEEKYLFTKCIEEFYKLLNNFSHYTYHCMFFNDKMIIDSFLNVSYSKTDTNNNYPWRKET